MRLIKFYTDTCGPCKVMKPIVDRFVEEHPEIEYEEINCSNGVPEGWDIRNVPTLLFDNGNEIKRIVGITTYENLENTFKQD